MQKWTVTAEPSDIETEVSSSRCPVHYDTCAEMALESPEFLKHSTPTCECNQILEDLGNGVGRETATDPSRAEHQDVEDRTSA